MAKKSFSKNLLYKILKRRSASNKYSLRELYLLCVEKFIDFDNIMFLDAITSLVQNEKLGFNIMNDVEMYFIVMPKKRETYHHIIDAIRDAAQDPRGKPITQIASEINHSIYHIRRIVGIISSFGYLKIIQKNPLIIYWDVNAEALVKSKIFDKYASFTRLLNTTKSYELMQEINESITNHENQLPAMMNKQNE